MRRATIVFIAILALLLPSAAQAHATWWYGLVWSVNPIFWFADHDFDSGKPANPAVTATLYGAGQWNALNQSRVFYHNGSRYDLTYGDAGAYNVNGIFYMVIPGGGDIYGQVTAWAYGGEIEPFQYHSFDMRFNSAVSWYMGTGRSLTPKADWFSIASHEFGHAIGFFTHWDTETRDPEPQLCTAGANYHTMCSGHTPGTYYMRDLATHDKDTFINVY